MTFELEPWDALFGRLRHNRALVDGYRRYLNHCAAIGIPPIFEQKHLSDLIGLPSHSILQSIGTSSQLYRTFHIPKRQREGFREISAPFPRLLAAQRWILYNILDKVEVSKNAHGGVLGRSIVTNASAHLGQKCVLKIDIRDFYPSIRLPSGIGIFNSLKYPPGVSRSLGLLCFKDGRLPQGAATSAAIANILMMPVDRRLSALSEKYGLSYTRYIDDLTFSGDFINPKLAHIIGSILEDVGYNVNEEKTRLMRGRSPKFVTGLSVGGDRLRVPRTFRRSVRNSAVKILTCGIEAHIRHTESNDPLIIERILGQLAFWQQVDPLDEAPRALFQKLLTLSREYQSSVELSPATRIAIPQIDIPARKLGKPRGGPVRLQD